MSQKKYGHGAKPSKDWYSHSMIRNCQDCFGYMFPDLQDDDNNFLPFTDFVKESLQELGRALGAKAATNQTDSKIPAGFTYLGQFIDHDITLDPFSSIEQLQDARDIMNFRTPFLDLDSVYGRGPSVDPHLYDHDTGNARADGIKLLLGENTNLGPGGPNTRTGGMAVPRHFDVPRTSDTTAMIGDPRNNENLFISQMHHAFLKFHNAVVDHLLVTGFSGDLFAEAKRMVVHHYQWIVVYDFLKRLIRQDILDKIFKDGNQFFTQKEFRMPAEFAVAAYRFGHSMIRDRYGFNDNFPDRSLLDAFQFANEPSLLPVFSNWVVDFNRFFETGSSKPMNMAKKIDSHMAIALSSLPGGTGFMAVLASRNLQRGLALRIPTGQAIAKALGINNRDVLTIQDLLNGATKDEAKAIQKGQFGGKTPLWYYILKEAELQEDGENLGAVGSWILGETFYGMLKENPNSFLHHSFTPSLPQIDGSTGNDFTMADLLHFAGVLSQ
jgi:hypothetical protein